ncbi:GH36-type glycosyl hydrolase domain-containing protein [Thalassotalea agarivorans]|uniref:Cellobionic acid phosphorylase n=1 Tax=Thalassotalea agarivorans TaxID=349064 RepID=A0A1I0E140_THASX|nr:NdvB protein [Thalassotalea agarivorans]SET38741.1 cellobionic acid phosphorylase [Thalassotalea agarivorans]
MKLFSLSQMDERITLHSPTTLPKASGFLWNSQMMINMNCRGYAVAQFMQPEPAKYSHGPAIEATTFMQPEHPYYAHHPGRFFYIKTDKHCFSLPYEPMRAPLDSFAFTAGHNEVTWQIQQSGLLFDLVLSLVDDDCIEHWQLNVKNTTSTNIELSLYPYFSVGYKSWMNQSADFEEATSSIVARAITPYQKVDDYFKNQALKDITFLSAETAPDFWSCNQASFEGEGGLHNPDGVNQPNLTNDKSAYQTPAAVMQYQISLQANEQKSFKFLFGAVKSDEEIAQKRQHFEASKPDKNGQCQQRLTMHSQHSAFDHFINYWLPHQVSYHGESNRLTTDPQTRNYLQDALGCSYLDSLKTRQAIITALSQQHISGAMPDGILLHKDATLKYINQVPHTDHCVWLPLTLAAYLDETNDVSILSHQIPYQDSDELDSVKDHLDKAMCHLLDATDERGLSLIAQGDWCDPMNMVGYKGKGVSAWLTFATAYALKTWQYCYEHYVLTPLPTFFKEIAYLNAAANNYFWHNQWFGRGITDEGRLFGTDKDAQGSMFLNPQSWAFLSGALDKSKFAQITDLIDQHLNTPFGVQMLAPAYTEMVEDVGRVTQKFPGVAENGSVYNHATAFYIYSLYQAGLADKAYAALNTMIPNLEDASIRGQLPNFIPNYYRGDYAGNPDTAGVSSQLFNTGTVAWVYRIVIEELCGLKGQKGDLLIQPKLPSHWQFLQVKRYFQGAHFEVNYQRKAVQEIEVFVDSQSINGNIITTISPQNTYKVDVWLPK